MNNQSDPLEKAISDLGWRNKNSLGERVVQIACLVRESDWRPLRVEWWQGKEVCVMGAAVNGDLFLRHCYGSVGLWEQSSQTDSIVAASVREFVSRIEE